VKDSPLKSWRNRHVDDIAERLMTATAQLISDVCVRWFAAEELS
jgi:hypothetical protein